MRRRRKTDTPMPDAPVAGKFSCRQRDAYSGEGAGAPSGGDMGGVLRRDARLCERGAGELGHQGGMAVTGVMRMLNAGAVTAQHGGRCPVGVIERQNYEIILSVGHSVRLLVRELQPEHQLALARPCLAQQSRHHPVIGKLMFKFSIRRHAMILRLSRGASCGAWARPCRRLCHHPDVSRVWRGQVSEHECDAGAVRGASRSSGVGTDNVMPLDEVVEHLQTGEPLPDRSVAITIDDAYLSVYEEAFPRLKERGFTATLFIATRPVDRNLPGYMNWDQIREWQAAGFGVGSQTQTHPHAPHTDRGQPARAGSFKRTLSRRAGIAADAVRLSLWRINRAVLELVRETGFEAAFGQNSGVAHGYNGFFELPRFALNEQYGDRNRLETAINGLPLKVNQIVPEDVMLTTNPPLYGFTLAEDMDQERQLRCFNSKYGKLDVAIIGRRAEIRMPGPLVGKRPRVNCTMPGPEGRWRWFGRQFLPE